MSSESIIPSSTDPKTLSSRPEIASNDDIRETLNSKENVILDLDETIFADSKGDTAQYSFDYIVDYYRQIYTERDDIYDVVQESFRENGGTLMESLVGVEEKLIGKKTDGAPRVVPNLLKDEEFKRLIREDSSNVQAKKAVKSLKEKGKKIIVSTNSGQKMATYKLEVLGLWDDIDEFFPRRSNRYPDMPKKGKGRSEFLEGLGFTKENTVYIGNSYEDDAREQLIMGYDVILLDTIGSYPKSVEDEVHGAKPYYVKDFDQIAEAIK
jgi:FMN phosphatase YigB (HAD superfamily)